MTFASVACAARCAAHQGHATTHASKQHGVDHSPLQHGTTVAAVFTHAGACHLAAVPGLV